MHARSRALSDSATSTRGKARVPEDEHVSDCLSLAGRGKHTGPTHWSKRKAEGGQVATHPYPANRSFELHQQTAQATMIADAPDSYTRHRIGCQTSSQEMQPAPHSQRTVSVDLLRRCRLRPTAQLVGGFRGAPSMECSARRIPHIQTGWLKCVFRGVVKCSSQFTSRGLAAM